MLGIATGEVMQGCTRFRSKVARQIDSCAIRFEGGTGEDALAELEPSATMVAFRLKRAEQFARAWRSNAKRLQTLANNPRTPTLVRNDALTEARTAARIVAQRAGELAELAKLRGYAVWEADPQVGPLVVEIRSVETALSFAAEALKNI